MPWMERQKMALKMEFVEKAVKPGANMARLCKQYGISRQTGYKWVARFRRRGFEGLNELSRRPKSVPLATAEDVVMAVLQLRERYPRYGAEKLAAILPKSEVLPEGLTAPSASTIARILKRAGRVRQRSRYRRGDVPTAVPRLAPTEPNDIWTVDFKGWWRTRDGARCEPLTIRDAFSRFVLCVHVMSSPSLEETRAVFERVFRQYGLPRTIHCDNGSPFIHMRARGGLTRLSAWWVSLGIKLSRSRPACPQDNGGHERMHRDMREISNDPADTAVLQQHECDRWRYRFNHVRPHQALGNKTPADVYRKSDRKLPKATRWLYPPDFYVRRVNDYGHVKIWNTTYVAGKGLAGYDVGLQVIDSNKAEMWFRDMSLGAVKLEIADLAIDDAVERFDKTKKRGVT